MIKLKQSLIVIFIIFICLEVVSTLLNKFSNQLEIFRVWGFAELTKNGRITLKKNHESNVDDKWMVYTDENRLRTRSIIDNKNINTDIQKILFIGDSVPFGWGVSYENSIPGILENKFSKMTVLNGSIPSFSLSQSVERFEKEFKNIKNIKFIYLQIIDPAMQYNYMRGDWVKNVNWSNIVFILDLKDKFLFKYDKLPLYGELNFLKLIQKFYYKYVRRGTIKKFKKIDETSDRRFVNHINNELNKIYKLINKDTTLIISPATLNIKKNKEIYAINLLNLQLKNFNKENVIYLDTINLLKKYDADKIYIDNCCHLSKLGNVLVANEIYKVINASK